MFGIDKTVLRNWDIESIDFDKLRTSRSKIIIQTEGYTIPVFNCKTGKLEELAYLKITDGFMFNTLQFGVKITGGKQIIYTFLDLHINEDKGGGNNVKPLKIKEYHELISKIEKYLYTEYGLNVNLKKSKFETVELNKTIRLDRNFQEYRHILELMCMLAPKTYKNKKPKYDNYKKITGIEIGNKSVNCKVYNKTEQMKAVYKIEVEGDYMRIEYTLETSKKAEEVFDEKDISALTDEEIEGYLKKNIEKDLIKPIEKHIKIGDRQLKKIAKEEMSKDAKKWTRFFTLRALGLETEDGVKLVTSREQIEKILEKNISRKNNYQRTIERLEKDFAEHKKFNNNFEKLEELKAKIFN